MPKKSTYRRLAIRTKIFFLCWAFFLALVLCAPGQARTKKKDSRLIEIPKLRLEANVSLEKKVISGTASIELPPKKVVWINVRNVKVKRVSLAGRLIEPEIEKGTFRVLSTSPRQTLKVTFSTKLGKQGLYASSRALVLTENWFPSIKGSLAYYDLHVRVPRHFRAVAPADEIKKAVRGKEAAYHFVFPHPAEAPPLIAGPFHYYERKYRGVTLATYLLKKEDHLAETYLSRLKKYLHHYRKLIGPYPYKRFAVVENIFPTGYAYPTLTLLGNTVIRLPFIAEISLRHELLHNWFGNGVYVKEEEGNWCEGLVTYLADHLAAQEKGKGADYRHRLLVEYESYVTPENDFPLKDFRFRTDKASQAIGYGKAALLFHMLEKRLGQELFYKALRNFYHRNIFRQASWRELKKAFEKVSESSLKNFFDQWLKRTGLPRLTLNRERLLPLEDGKYLVGLSVTQEEPFYELTVPIRVISEKETKEAFIFLTGPRARIDLTLRGKPLWAYLDPEFDLARHLSEPEFPPVLARLLAPRGGRIVLFNPRRIHLYRALVNYLRERHYHLEIEPLLPEETSKNLVYLDQIPLELEPLFQPLPEEAFCLEVKENPKYPEAIVVWAKAGKKEISQKALRKLNHLGQYEKVCFADGKTVLKREPSYERGIKVNLANDVRGVSLKKLFPLETVARAISLHRVIFLGEQHDRYEEHLAQLEIIRWLHENGHRIAIGMEMFQAPFQKVLDDYIAGKIDEITFLRRSEYFKRWGFNWRLYKPILDYARKKRIPVVAINVPAEITDKVAKKGLNALSPEERAQLPELDRKNQAYREYLRFVYETHPENRREIKDFETFYQAQLLWDEGMAENIVRYLKAHPQRQMVVLVGRAHVVYGYGIPSRVARRGIEDYSIVLLSPSEGLSPAMADYALFPAPEPEPFFAKLGVLIEETDKGLIIRQVVPGTPASKAGLKVNDVIVEADGKKISDLADLKLVLYQKKPQDHVELVVLRGHSKKKIKVGPFTSSKKNRFHHGGR